MNIISDIKNIMQAYFKNILIVSIGAGAGCADAPGVAGVTTQNNLNKSFTSQFNIYRMKSVGRQ